MEIQNRNNSEDMVIIDKSDKRETLVQLDIGKGTSSRHAHLQPTEARAVAYALLSYAEQVSEIRSIDCGTI